LNIAIVGAGAGGTKMIESFSKIEDIRIEKVIDSRLDAPGIMLAKTLGISCSQSIDDISIKNLDLIIEATGNENVKQGLNERYNGKCTIIDSAGALLIVTLVERDIHAMNKLSKQISAIKSSSAQIQDQLRDITDSIDSTHTYNRRLYEITQKSIEYIEETDKIINYVNNISKQTKILGINANIEAARAGEQGRGFSVVASEVQKMAASSESFAKEINQILTKLSGEIREVEAVAKNLSELSELQVKASVKVNEAVSGLSEQISQ
jgi:methyl-accepting chemotaxis protein